jgi:hypothetical protein
MRFSWWCRRTWRGIITQGPGRSTLHHRISAIYNQPIKAQQQPGRTRLRSSAGCRQRIIHYPARLSGASIGFLSAGREGRAAMANVRTRTRTRVLVWYCLAAVGRWTGKANARASRSTSSCSSEQYLDQPA